MTLKTTNIKGKEYVEVNERLKYFRSNYPNYSLISEVVEKTHHQFLSKLLSSTKRIDRLLPDWLKKKKARLILIRQAM